MEQLLLQKQKVLIINPKVLRLKHNPIEITLKPKQQPLFLNILSPK